MRVVTTIASVCFMIMGLHASTICRSSHPQVSFCNADYALKVRVTDDLFRTNPKGSLALENGKIVIKGRDDFGFKLPVKVEVSVVESFKGDVKEGSKIILEHHTPFTTMPRDKFVNREQYMVTGRVIGGRYRLSYCDWFTKWTRMSFVQRWGVSHHYAAQCACADEYKATCPWTALDRWQMDRQTDCLSQNALCLKKRGKCEWFIPNIPCRVLDKKTIAGP